MGFKEGIITADNILRLRNLTEKMNKTNEELIGSFLNLKVVVDMIERSILWEIMKMMEIPRKLNRRVKSIYNTSWRYNIKWEQVENLQDE